MTMDEADDPTRMGYKKDSLNDSYKDKIGGVSLNPLDPDLLSGVHEMGDLYKVRDVHPDTKPTDTALPENNKRFYCIHSLLTRRYNPNSEFAKGPVSKAYSLKRKAQNAIPIV